MAHAHAAPDRVRLHVVDAETASDLRVTSHVDAGLFVVSVWRGSVCTGTIRLEPEEAARLVSHIAAGLGAMAETPGHRTPLTTDEHADHSRWGRLVRRLRPPGRHT